MFFLDKCKITKLSIILFIIAIALLIYCQLTTNVVFSSGTVSGLAEKLNAYYWVGLICVLISLVLLVNSSVEASRCEKVFLMQTVLLSLYLYAISAFVEENIHFYDTWMHSARSFSILLNQNHTISSEYYSSQFPGAFLYQCVGILITGINALVIMKYFPLLLSVLTVVASYILFRKIFFDRKMAYLATVFLVTGSVWVLPKHFCPNSIAIILYLLFFYFLISRHTTEKVGLMTLLVIAIVTSHPITPIFIFLSLLSIFIGIKVTKRFSFSKIYNIPTPRFISANIMLFLFILIFSSAWFLFAANDLLIDQIRNVSEFLQSLGDYLTFGRFTERFATTSTLLKGQMLKIAYSLLFVSLSAIGGVYLIISRFKRHAKEKAYFFPFMTSWIVACVIFGIITGFLQAGEFYERVLLYGFVPLSYFAVFAWRTKIGKIILIIGLLIGAPLSVFATYSNESFEYVSTTDLHGVQFMVNHNIQNTINVKVGLPTATCYRFFILYNAFQNEQLSTKQSLNKNMFLVWSYASYAYYSVYLRGANYSTASCWTSYETWLDERSDFTSIPGFDLLYSNSEFMLWMKVDTTLQGS